MWGAVLGRSAGLKPKTTARSWWNQGSTTCRVLLDHLQYRAMESHGLKSWEDGSVWKAFAEQAYVPEFRSPEISFQTGQSGDHDLPYNSSRSSPAVWGWLCPSPSGFFCPLHVVCLSKHLKGRYLPWSARHLHSRCLTNGCGTPFCIRFWKQCLGLNMSFSILY